MRSPFRGLPRAFVVLWCGMLVNRLGGFVVPFLAIYLTSQRGFSVERAGLILSLYGAGSVLAGPLGGWLSDRLGRKVVMVTSLCLGACCVLALALVRSGPAVAGAVFCVSFFLLMLGIALIYSQATCTLPVDMQRHGISAAGYGYIIAVNGVLIVLLQPWVSQRLGDLPPARVLALNGVVTGIGFGIQALAGGVPVYVAAIVVWTLGEIIGAPMGSAVVAALAPASLRGTYQGAFQTAWGGGAFLAPMLGGLVMGRFGGPALWTSCMALGCLVGVGHWFVTGAMLERSIR